MSVSVAESPFLVLQSDITAAPQKDLRRSYAVFPFLAEMLPVDNPINAVITKVGMDALHSMIDVHGSQWSTSQEVQDGVGKNAVRCSSRSTNTQEIVIHLANTPTEFSTQASSNTALRSLTHLAQFNGDRSENGQLRSVNRRPKCSVIEHVPLDGQHSVRLCESNAVLEISK